MLVKKTAYGTPPSHPNKKMLNGLHRPAFLAALAEPLLGTTERIRRTEAKHLLVGQCNRQASRIADAFRHTTKSATDARKVKQVLQTLWLPVIGAVQAVHLSGEVVDLKAYAQIDLGARPSVRNVCLRGIHLICVDDISPGKEAPAVAEVILKVYGQSAAIFGVSRKGVTLHKV